MEDANVDLASTTGVIFVLGIFKLVLMYLGVFECVYECFRYM